MPHSSPSGPSAGFPETLWEDISAVRRGQDHTSLQALASAYWRPLYGFLRSSGHSHEDAADHVQGFFLHVLSTEFFSAIDREGGKFRSYLIASLRNWMARNYHRNAARKRGGGVAHVPLDPFASAELPFELADAPDPELLYDRLWARELIARSAALVRAEYQARGIAATFTVIAGALPGGGGPPPYSELAETLNCTEAAARKAIFLLRNRFAEIVRREIRATVRSTIEAEEEFEHLFRVLSRSDCSF